MKPVEIIVIGGGDRGFNIFGSHILNNPHEIKITGVAEPLEIRRKKFIETHNFPGNMAFNSWEDVFNLEKMADGVIITTTDRLHVAPAIAAMKKGYAVLLEKPIALNPEEIRKVYETARATKARIMVAHILRYTPFYRKIKSILDSGVIGELIGINQTENVGYFHFPHSYVRGNWRNTDVSGPSILTKCSHDFDILSWLADSPCKRLSSFGNLYHFKKDKAPDEVPDNCLHGCNIEGECPYSAKHCYMEMDWGATPIITEDPSQIGKVNALERGPYGRCVYHSDNNVADHQITNIEFQSGVIASFTMTAFTPTVTRKIFIYGSRGHIYGDLIEGKIELSIFGQEKNLIDVPSGEYRGDEIMIKEFVDLINGKKRKAETSLDAIIESHVMALMAEESRRNNGKMIEIESFWK